MKNQNDIEVILGQLRDILIRKQSDYGPLNISLAPGGPLNGLRVRMFDKLQRFSHLVETGNDTPNYESLEDTFIDLANYAIIGLLVQRGQWEGISSAQDTSTQRPSDTVPRPRGYQDGIEVHTQRETPRTMVRRGRVGRPRTKSME